MFRMLKKMRGGPDVLPQKDTERENIKLWAELYAGRAPWLSPRVKSLGLPAAICSEIARLTTIELRSEVSGGQRGAFLDKAYQQVLSDIRRQVEYGCAKSGLIFKPYVKNGGLAVSCVQADCFFPMGYDGSGNLTDVVFLDSLEEGGKVFYRLERHKIGEPYVITNQAFSADRKGELGREIALSDVPAWQGIQPKVSLSGVRSPLFGYFRFPGANPENPHSVHGVAAFSKAINLIREADKQYSRLLWEFESGERALYVSEHAFRRDKDGRLSLPDQRLYRALSLDMGEKDLFEDYSPAFREEAILRGLDAILRKVEFHCGLAYGALSDVQQTNKTAEEIRASEQRSYATVCDVQKALRNALSGLVAAMDSLATLYHLAPEGAYAISFEFDDTIAADRKTEFSEKLELLNKGVLKPWELRMWYLGEDEQTAKAKVDEELRIKNE